MDQWHPEQIKAAIRMRGLTLRELAGRLKLDASNLTLVVRGHRSSRRIERAIAQLIEVPPHELWPDRWTPRGKRIDRRRRENRREQ